LTETHMGLVGYGLDPPPSDLTDPMVRNRGFGQCRRVMKTEYL
jgi:hypothetical protein